MNNAHDDNRLTLDPVENPVLSMKKASDVFAQFRPCRPGFGMIAEEGEAGAKAACIVLGDLNAPLGFAIGLDVIQISIGLCAEAQLSHAPRAAWR